MLIKNSVSEPKIINYLTLICFRENMFAGQNESKMLRNSRQREVETALWCLTILIWVRVFIYVLQGNIFFWCRSRGCPLFFSPAVLDLGLISIASLGTRATTKVESQVNFTESQKVSQPIFFLQCLTQRS